MKERGTLSALPSAESASASFLSYPEMTRRNPNKRSRKRGKHAQRANKMTRNGNGQWVASGSNGRVTEPVSSPESSAGLDPVDLAPPAEGPDQALSAVFGRAKRVSCAVVLDLGGPTGPGALHPPMKSNFCPSSTLN